MILKIFCKRALFVTFIGVSFTVVLGWSSREKVPIMTLQLNAAARSSRLVVDPGNADLNLLTRPAHSIVVNVQDWSPVFLAALVATDRLGGRFMPVSTAAFLVRAGLLIFWLQLDVSGFRPVLARGWHGAHIRASWQWTPVVRWLSWRLCAEFF